MIKSIRKLQIVRHQLTLNRLASVPSKHQHFVIARGTLVGDLYQSALLSADETIDFTGDFQGFFESERDWTDEESFYFQGRIDNISILAINGNIYDHRCIDISDFFFAGYFKGTFWSCERIANTYKPMHRILRLSALSELALIRQKREEHLLIPTYTRFIIKKVVSVNLDKSVAEVSGILSIQLQLSHELKCYFDQHRQLTMTLTFNRQNPIVLPLTATGDNGDDDWDIEMQYFDDKSIMRYVISGIFTTEIDATYSQFFAPFNLNYLKLIVTMLDTTFKTPTQVPWKTKQGINRRSLHLKFVNMSLPDTTDQNPYQTYNQLLSLEREDLAANRITSISLLESNECGEYILATNYFSLFPYHSNLIPTSDKRSSNQSWSYGIVPRNNYIRQPRVESIRECFEDRQHRMLLGEKLPTKIFRVLSWNNVHIEMPIYKYWVVNVIQILLPLFVLSAISLFIFKQETGRRENGTSNLNLKILNVASIMIAYVALIPMIRENGPRATYISFLYIVIYLSMIPNLLALVQGFMNQNVYNKEWEQTYEAFKDGLFLISFILIVTLLSIVIIVTAVFVKSSYADFQIKREVAKNKRRFLDAAEPQGFHQHIQDILAKRSNQFIFHKFKEPEQEQK